STRRRGPIVAAAGPSNGVSSSHTNRQIGGRRDGDGLADRGRRAAGRSVAMPSRDAAAKAAAIDSHSRNSPPDESIHVAQACIAPFPLTTGSDLDRNEASDHQVAGDLRE